MKITSGLITVYKKSGYTVEIFVIKRVKKDVLVTVYYGASYPHHFKNSVHSVASFDNDKILTNIFVI